MSLLMANPNKNPHHLTPPTTAPFTSLTGINPLVGAAMPLLLLLIKLKQTNVYIDIHYLQRQILNEIAYFETRAKNFHYPSKLVLAARYCLCTALDEAILLTTWGNNSNWAQQTLLNSLQKETWGGERFFIILEKMTEKPKKNLSALELIYLLLSLGFEGKYYNAEHTIRTNIRHRLFQLIMQQRERPYRKLSSTLKTIEKTADIRPASRLKIMTGTLCILFLLWLVFNIATYCAGYKTMQALNDINPPAFNLLTAAGPVKTQHSHNHQVN